MSIAIIAPDRDQSGWIKYFKRADPGINVEIWPEIMHPEKVTCVMTWNHPHGELLNYPNLKLICSMGAGVDHILSDPDLPLDIPITKIVDKHLSRDMSNYVISAVLNYQRDFIEHYEAQKSGTWLSDHRWPKKLSIGIFGLGTLGQDLAKKLVALEFNVHGYSQTKKAIDGVTCYDKGELNYFFKAVNVLVCLMPLTSRTEGILDRKLFQQLNKGTFLINVARGQHLNDNDLLEAIDDGIIGGAMLDVFHQEPLPTDHPFWKRNEIIITPHNASVTDPVSVADQIVDNYKRMNTGQAFKYQIDLKKGY